MAEHGSGGKNAKGAAIIAGVVATALVIYLLYVITGFEAPLGADLLEIIVGMVSFGALFLLLSRLVFPKFEQIYAERNAKIDGGLAQAEKTHAEALELKEQYEAQLAEAR
ncbi:ATP synthase F0 subunit B, partial [Pseudonocardia pini]|uniref:ATP synthase F0 subunit B n=1 Tax=Pseudonocardia pini TaxID=2758030 RepID=UPI0015F0C193